mgnify:CR=1 FL=1
MENNMISVKRHVKTICVNKSGQTISIDMEDQEFVSGIVVVVRRFEDKQKEYRHKIQELETMPHETEAEQIAQAHAVSAFSAQLCRELKTEVDAAFRDHVCEKVFGNITPSLELFAEFFRQLHPFIKEAAVERNKRIRKYTEKYQKRSGVG